MDFGLDLISVNQSFIYQLDEDHDVIPSHQEINNSCMADLMPQNFYLDRFYFISCYVIMLVIGTAENLAALQALYRHRYRNHGTKLLLFNLTIANLIVAMLVLPIEIAWRFTIVWPTGEFGCKLLQFCRALGHYSTSSMLVVISLDRFLVLSQPFCRRSTKTVVTMLIGGWMAAVLLSLPHVSALAFPFNAHLFFYYIIVLRKLLIAFLSFVILCES